MTFEIKNKHHFKIIGVIDVIPNPKGIAFVAHGLGGFKEQIHIRSFAKALNQARYTTIRWDMTNSIGESGGKMEDATITSYYEDLQDVISWAKQQSWFKSPFILCGHSLGGISTALYAEEHPEEVLGLAPLSSVVSGKLTFETEKSLEDWKKRGYKMEMSRSKPGIMKKLKWSHMEDRLKYDLLPNAGKLTMPVILIVREKDDGTPARHQRLLFDAIPGDKKELHIVKGCPHSPVLPWHLNEFKTLLKTWAEKL